MALDCAFDIRQHRTAVRRVPSRQAMNKMFYGRVRQPENRGDMENRAIVEPRKTAVELAKITKHLEDLKPRCDSHSTD